MPGALSSGALLPPVPLTFKQEPGEGAGACGGGLAGWGVALDGMSSVWPLEGLQTLESLFVSGSSHALTVTMESEAALGLWLALPKAGAT